MSIIGEIFAGNCGNHIHPFTALSARETEADIAHKVRTLHEAGINSMDLLWENPDRQGNLSPFNAEVYWQHMAWVVRYCRQYNMTFMVQDAAPFPTGRADGWLDKAAYAALRKLYLAQRHMDVLGPLCGGRFRIDLLTGTKKTEGLFEGTRTVVNTADKLVAVLAIKLNETGSICAEPLDLTESVEDGILFWDVPHGKWRILSVYETYSGGGREGFMNLLDKESVALQIEAVYESHYVHLKDEIGKTWLGMFYDEPEVGNLKGHFFTQRVGTPQDLGGAPMDLPWSREAAARWAAEQGAQGRSQLAYLWYDAVANAHCSVRYRYLELVSGLIRDNYNGQVHAWCQAHGLQYIGHVLEDENSHCRLSCGPVHFFRMEEHQDMGGIDMIGNQMIPGRDYVQAWFGSAEGDGEFYHYGLAKLASSAGHICHEKKGRSFCEIFAVYGVLAGTRMRKSVMDHLFVNGITELIPNDPVFDHLEMEYSRRQNEYANRMCHLLTHTKPVIKTAVLYHAENEWYAGDCMKFQVPAAELAKHQISYDVIPADVFLKQQFYQTDCTNGLCINGNRYEALIVPESVAVPQAVADFLSNKAANDCAVFYVNHAPTQLAETGAPLGTLRGSSVSLTTLAAAVQQSITPDLRVQEGNPNLRYAHYEDCSGGRSTHLYLLYNQGEACRTTVHTPYSGKALQVDLMDLQTQWLPAQSEADGCSVALTLGAQEAVLVCFGDVCTEAGLQQAALSPKPCLIQKSAMELSDAWQVTLADNGSTIALDALQDLGGKGMYPRYCGKLIYEKTVCLTDLPKILELGEVYDTARLYINGKEVGMRMAPGYRFDVAGFLTTGENTIRVEVHPNQGARPIPQGLVESVIEAVSAAAYCPLAPIGMLGPVSLIFA